jgi:hypothetical protein
LHATTWQFDGVIVEGLRMTLQADEAGRWNVAAMLDAMAAAQATEVHGGETQPGVAPSGRTQPGRALHIHPLQLRNSELQLRMRPGSAPWQLSRLNLQANLDRSADGRELKLAELQLSADVRGGSLPAAEAVTVQSAGVVVDMPPGGAEVGTGAGVGASSAGIGGSVRIQPVQLRLGEATLRLSAAQPLRWQPLQGEGDLQFDTAALRSWLAAQGMTTPPTRDTSALRTASMATHWKIDAAQAELSALQLRLDDTRLTGRIGGHWQSPQDWQIELQGDALDADRYRRPDSDPGEPFQLPVDALRALPLNGSVRLQQLSGGGVVARDALIELKSGAP